MIVWSTRLRLWYSIIGVYRFLKIIDAAVFRLLFHLWLHGYLYTCHYFQACHTAGGDCSTIVDGFYLELVFCLLVGLITYPSLIRPLAKRLDSLPPSVFSIRSSSVIQCCRRGRRRQSNWIIAVRLTCLLHCVFGRSFRQNKISSSTFGYWPK